jgi:hypothetical protein
MLEKDPGFIGKDLNKLASKMVATSPQRQTSAINLSDESMDSLEKGVRELGNQIKEMHSEDDLARLRQIVKQSQHFYRNSAEDQSRGLVDLYDFTERLINDSYFQQNNKKLLEAASSLMRTKDLVVINEKHKQLFSECGEEHGEFYVEVSGAKGINIYLSTFGYQPTEGVYKNKNMKFLKNTDWVAVNEHIKEEK